MPSAPVTPRKKPDLCFPLKPPLPLSPEPSDTPVLSGDTCAPWVGATSPALRPSLRGGGSSSVPARAAPRPHKAASGFPQPVRRQPRPGHGRRHRSAPPCPAVPRRSVLAVHHPAAEGGGRRAGPGPETRAPTPCGGGRSSIRECFFRMPF